MPDALSGSVQETVNDIVAIRDKWHTKHHPLFTDMTTGSLDLRALGVYMAQHGKFVQIAYKGFGAVIARAPKDVQAMIIENLAEEEGLLAGSDGEAHNHSEMIFDFCEAAGLSRDEVANAQPSPAWWGRSLYYLYVCQTEPVGAALAMMFTQEGQMPELNGEVVIPALIDQYGYTRDAKEIRFFVEHEMADIAHSENQLELCARHLDDPAAQARARTVCEDACRLRWAAASETYRLEALGEAEHLPPGMVA